MKKVVMVLSILAILSAPAFAFGNRDGHGKMGGSYYSAEENGGCKGFESNTKLTDEQKKEISSIRAKYISDIEKLRLSAQEKRIAVEKLLLEEKIDWNKVEKAVQDESAVRVQLKMIHLKMRTEIKAKTGVDFPGNGKGMHEKKHMM